ncbi:hypothetical protein MGYG_08363 [Nannizzia gypsea CBS 118893]|uniref:Major facilitator superfamily (MFS) profile domain-containing protein n=1 Tax=Arthroderma gypseum (strain ATCC MYA-4604 / CBS 118893) TaxID=535722 RepID=E4V5H7_ARTGP|nr:hypothetical protein MGYG_08363 [Nannizzia gypsea CBS 118893]EFR05352.1 hypothetical protein MGYG_08363 [Nannizzia gypsea CBS 118893]
MCEPEKKSPKGPIELPDTSIAMKPSTNGQRMRLFGIIAVLFFSVFLTLLEPAILLTLIPRISSDFDDSEHAGWYSSAYVLTFASLQPSWGKIYRCFSLKPAFLISLLILGLGSIICGAAAKSNTFIAGRAISGIAGGGIITGAYTIIGHTIKNERQRSLYIGILGAAFGISNIAGAYIGKLFLGAMSYRWVFYVNTAIGSLCFIALLLCFAIVPAAVPPSTSRREKLLLLDLPGFVTVWPSMVCYVVSMQSRKGVDSWSRTITTVTRFAFGVLLATFFLSQWWSGNYANIRLRLFATRDTAACSAFTFFLAGAFATQLYNLPTYAQSLSELSVADSRIRMIPLMVGVSSSSILSGYLMGKFRYYTPMLVIGASFTIIGCGLIYTLDATTTAYRYATYQVITGIGIGAAQQLPIMVNMSAVKIDDLSTIIAATFFLQSIGGFFFNQTSQVAFVGILRKLTATSTDPKVVTAIRFPITSLRDEYTGANLIQVLEAYHEGIKGVSIIGITAAGMALVLSISPQWKSLYESN